MIERTNCILCNAQDFVELAKITNFPIYMGAAKEYSSEVEDITFAQCRNCATIQLSEMVPLDVLYKENHNTEVVGRTWKKHIKEFESFVMSGGKCEKVLEVGDPSFKHEMILAKSKKWYSAQPGKLAKKKPKKVTHLSRLVEQGFSEEMPEKVDTIVLSHVLEHFYSPRESLVELARCLTSDGSIFISVPDVEYQMENSMMPPLGMHFEHTYYGHRTLIQQLIASCNLAIHQVVSFDDHSVFFEVKLKNPTNPVQRLTEQLDYFKVIVNQFNSQKDDFYIYGCHFPAQLLIALGLNQNKIKGVLDNSPQKQGLMLYGTELPVFSPDVIEKEVSPLVLLEMGVYNEEIERQLKELNMSVRFTP